MWRVGEVDCWRNPWLSGVISDGRNFALRTRLGVRTPASLARSKKPAEWQSFSFLAEGGRKVFLLPLLQNAVK